MATGRIQNDDSGSQPTIDSSSLSEVNGLYPELAMLALRAYGPTESKDQVDPGFSNQSVYDMYRQIDQRWTPLQLSSVHVIGKDEEYVNGMYRNGNAAAYIAESMVGTEHTVAIAFRGTDYDDVVADVSDWFSDPVGYGKFTQLIAGLDAYVANPNNHVSQVFVTGHSIGGTMVQRFMDAAAHKDTSNIHYYGATFGSPGAHTIGLDGRLVQFANTRDPVPALGLNTPNAVVLAMQAKLAAMAVDAGAIGGAAAVLGLVGADLAAAGIVAVGSDSTPKSGFYNYVGDAVWLDTPLNEWPLSTVVNPIQEHQMLLYASEIWRIAKLQDQPIFKFDGAAPAAQDLAHIIIGYGNQANGDPLIGGPFLNGDTWGFDSPQYLVGGSLSDVVKGGSKDDWLWGLEGNDSLDGGGGADRMYGGAGNDIYYVGQVGDQVFEKAGNAEGIDKVISSLDTYVLTDNVEQLDLKHDTGFFSTGLFANDKPLNGTGNALNNTINGNSASNVISGGAGNDTIMGGAGNDTIDGGAGIDTAAYASSKTAYTITRTTTGFTISVGSDGTDTLAGIEELQFSNQSIRLDKITGASDSRDVVGAYFTVLGRAPESSGFQYWSGQLGATFSSLGKMIDNWLTLSGVKANGYPDGQSIDSFIANIYRHMLNKASDDQGYWKSQSTHMTRGELVATMLSAADGAPAGIAGKAYIDNKIAAATLIVDLQYAYGKDISPADLTSLLDEVTAGDGTVMAAANDTVRLLGANYGVAGLAGVSSFTDTWLM